MTLYDVLIRGRPRLWFIIHVNFQFISCICCVFHLEARYLNTIRTTINARIQIYPLHDFVSSDFRETYWKSNACDGNSVAFVYILLCIVHSTWWCESDIFLLLYHSERFIGAMVGGHTSFVSSELNIHSRSWFFPHGSYYESIYNQYSESIVKNLWTGCLVPLVLTPIEDFLAIIKRAFTSKDGNFYQNYPCGKP